MTRDRSRRRDKHPRRIRVRGEQRDPVDLRKLSRALLALAQAQAEADAAAQSQTDGRKDVAS